MNTLTRLRETMDAFSATEQRIAHYVIDHIQTLTDSTISEVALGCHTSKSMVVQLCKKAGFKGFKDLCNTLCVEQALLQREDVGVYEDIHPDCTVEQICRITVQQEMRSIEDTFELIDPVQMERAVNAILKARRIHLFGVGNSGVVAQDMHNKLLRIGMNAHFVPDTHCQLMFTALLGEDDCAIVFSYNGQTRDIIEAVNYAKSYGATVISITRFGHNATSAASDIKLHVASNESLRRSGAMASRLSMLTMVDILFTCVASKQHKGIVELLERTNDIANQQRK